MQVRSLSYVEDNAKETQDMVEKIHEFLQSFFHI